MFYAILLDQLQTRKSYYCVTDFGDLPYCLSVANDDGTYVLLSKVRYESGVAQSTVLHTAQGHAEPGVILQLTERP